MIRKVTLLVGGAVALVACVGKGDPHDQTLVNVAPEPKGANCKYGGTVISTGIDKNHNSVLDTTEITSSSYICDTAATVKCVEGANNVPGPVSLTTAADFNALAGVSCIDGDLMIIGSDLATLPSLDSLETVTGSVIIAGNSELASLDGLPNIHEIGRKYVVQGNDSLTDLSAIGALKRFQWVTITGNDALVDLAGLDTFVEIEGGLIISNNSSLTSLHGLENLTRQLRETIQIKSNRNLTSIAALGNLRSAVLIDISSNANLAAAPLNSLETVDVYMLVKDNAAMTTLSLPALLTTGGLIVQSNPQLASLDVPKVVLSGSVTVDGNLSLATINAPKLSYTTVNFDMVNLPQLTQAVFSSLVAVGGPMQLYSLPKLADFSGFSNLSSVGGNLTVRACNGIDDFTGMGSLVDVANLTVTENAQLASFAGLNSFNRVGGDLVIANNPTLSQSTAQSFASAITVVGNVTINE